MTPETRMWFGLACLFASFADLAVGAWLLLQPQSAPELIRCERCGKPVQVDAVNYHRKRCSGVLRSMPVSSARRRAW